MEKKEFDLSFDSDEVASQKEPPITYESKKLDSDLQ